MSDPVVLTHGGELSITSQAGEYVLHVQTDSSSFAIRLAARDVQGIRELTGELTLAHLLRVEAADAAFARLLEGE